MTEKLKILEHHVAMIREGGFGMNGRERISEEAIIHKNQFRSRYPFGDENSRQETAVALEKAIIAVLDNNFEEIPDFKNEEETKQNYDLICFACPDYVPGQDLCSLTRKIKKTLEGVVKDKDFIRGLEEKSRASSEAIRAKLLNGELKGQL